MDGLACSECGEEIDPDDPGVGEGRNWDRDGEWFADWIPWIADLRGSPTRLVHPLCYVRSNGGDALAELVVRSERSRRPRT